ncbi:MAG: threonine/serine exporter family protein, partial [Planctomycetes bacterium]|nr:threonine/serine exporter family protein [Planctomycetota bacterium]
MSARVLLSTDESGTPALMTPMNDDDTTARFLQQLARALHVYGLPSHRLEEALQGMAEDLHCDAQFLVTPTAIVSSFGSETRLLRIDGGETHLERLAELNEIMSAVREGASSVDE